MNMNRYRQLLQRKEATKDKTQENAEQAATTKPQ